MRSCIKEVRANVHAVPVADGEGVAVRTEGDGSVRPHDCAAVGDLAVALERLSNLAQCLCVEEGDVAVVASEREQASAARECLVEYLGVMPVKYSERRGAAHQGGEEVAACGYRVVEVHAFAREQE